MGMAKACCSCCCCVLVLVAFAGLMVLAVKNACVVPFLTTVDEASLARMSLAAPVTAGHNGSTPAAALSYDLSLVLALRWYYRRAVGFSHAKPLEAELRFLGRPLGPRARLGGAEQAAATSYLSEIVYRLAWNGSDENATTALALGPGEAAAFAAESAARVFELELVIAGVFKSSVLFRSRWCGVRVNCPLRLSVSTPSVAAAVAAPPFASVECKS
ncbi:unnamed protein product [Urochloa decumbens]|uniref:Late embryogenesis abundant protein LEA-2 subgroup domain-containing protein n=1 Tax=Urochloa decumbens TaxID=240449 RepID=A0ABC9FF51_9POAL